MAYINHLYFYLWDAEWAGAFWKTNAYAPFPIWLWLNGHEWAKRQLEKAGIGYEALDNGFRSCTDPQALQQICNRLGPRAVKSFLWRWVRRLPSPFSTADWRAGYVCIRVIVPAVRSVRDVGVRSATGRPRVV